MKLRTLALAGAALICAHQAQAAPALTGADRAAAFKAAGFKAKGQIYTRCSDDPSASFMPGSIELEDLNKDGKPEAWVKESSTFCYGNTAEAFVLLTKNAAGAWTPILDEVGVAAPRATKHNGWPDIEVGGPGIGPFPVYRFNGAKYIAPR